MSGQASKDLTEIEQTDEISRIYELMFEASPEAVLIVDPEGRVRDCNARVTDWLGYSKDQIKNNFAGDLPFLNDGSKELVKKNFNSRILGHKVPAYEIECRAKDGELFYGQVMATVVKNNNGKTIADLVMISDITATKISKESEDMFVKDLGILSEAAVGFVELTYQSNIYHYIGNQLKNLVGDCFVIINVFNQETKSTRMKGIFGVNEKAERILFKMLRPNPMETDFPLSQSAQEQLISKRLVHVKEGLYGIGQGKFPKIVAKLAELTSSVTDAYTLGFSWKNQLFGNAVVLLRRNNQLREKSIEAFLHQASVALQRHQTEMELHRAHSELEMRVKERTHELEIIARDLEKFKLAVENASDLIVITDEKSNIVYANKAVETMTGYSSGEVIGKTPLLWGDKSDPAHQKIWDSLAETRKYVVSEVKNIRKNGQPYIAETHVAPVLDAGMKVIFCVYIERDITKAKEIDQAKSEFVSLASHQLRTPLSSINWYTEALKSGEVGEVNKEQKEYLEEVYAASQRMVDLVSSLLNVSRIDLGTFMIEPQESDITLIARSVINELQPLVTEKKIVIAEYFHKIPKISVDPKLMRIIFQNLISNAVKYTQNEGHVAVSIKMTKNNGLGQYVMIRVADNGYGIPKQQQDKVFTKLFRAENIKDKVSEGTGLGLYIVKSILDKSGGSIKFKSSNAGTVFTVAIPKTGMTKKVGDRELSEIR